MIVLIILDVDGTLTDGKITYSTNGEELKSFDAKDGLAIATWTKKLNKKVAIITGRSSEVVRRRAEELGITYLYQGIDNKDEIIEQILEKDGLSWNQVASIGDDLNDMKMLKKSKMSFCPSDSVEYIKKNVKIVCKNNGGNGSVREMIEYICDYDGILEEYFKAWE